MLVLSHRGYHAEAIENTEQAFQRALELGVDGIETDIRMSADGVPVLFHDRTVQGREVASLDHRELNELAGYAVPALESVVSRWGGIIWNLEIKAPSALEPTAQVVSRYRNSCTFLITSFWHNVVQRFSEGTDVSCGFLLAHRPLHLPEALTGGRPRRPNLDTIVWDFEVLDREVVENVAQAGMHNLAYGAETEQEHRRCSELGLFGVITDHPEFLTRPAAREEDY